MNDQKIKCDVEKTEKGWCCAYEDRERRRQALFVKKQTDDALG